jgi:hypothetical protein
MTILHIETLSFVIVLTARTASSETELCTDIYNTAQKSIYCAVIAFDNLSKHFKRIMLVNAIRHSCSINVLNITSFEYK